MTVRWRYPAGQAVLAAVTAVLVSVPVTAQPPPVVTAVDLISPHRLPEARVRAVLGELTNRPRSRRAIRESLDRLWALGLFDEVRVEEVPEGDGVRLRYYLPRRPHVRTVIWQGDLGLDVAELLAAAALALDGEARPERLAVAHRDVLALLRREGFLDGRLEIEAVADPETNARDVTVLVHAGERARVGQVVIRGAPELPGPPLARTFGLAEGDPYQERAAQDGGRAVEQRIREAGFYEARVAAGPPVRNPATTRVDLTLDVAAGPRYRLAFEGVTVLKETALRPRLTLAESGVVDEFELDASARQVAATYREQGYPFAEVTASQEKQEEVRVVRIRVREGPRVVVDAVDFTGSRAVPAEHLRATMETRPAGLLHRGLYRADVLDRDLGRLLAFLQSQGYAEARVGPADVRFVDARRSAYITIPITEGPRLTVGTVRVEGVTALPADGVRAVIPLAAGQPWQVARAEDGRRAIERRYARQGYHGAEVEMTRTRHGNAIDVIYRVQEGPQTRIGQVRLQGLILTDDRILRRALSFGPDDVLDPDRLLETQRRLVTIGPFESVTIEPLRPPPTPFADVEVTVRERKPWRLEFGAGYATDDGVRGFLEVGHDNLFGTGRSLSLREKVSGAGERIDFGERTDLVYREPWLFGTQWEAQVGLFREQREEIGYDLDRLGGQLFLQRELAPERIRGLRGLVRYRAERVRRSHVDPALAAADVVPGRQVVASLTPVLTLDHRDDPVNPRRGSLHLVSVEGAGAPLGSDVDFVKTRLETMWFVDWLPPTVFALSGRLGLATPLGGTTALPIEDRFFAGGATSVRGYREQRVGPQDAAGNPTGGNALLVLSAEWRFPLWRGLDGAVFFDTGAVTRDVGDFDVDALRSGVGVGLRLPTPVGPLRFDVAYALNPIPGERRTQFYLTVGFPF